MTWDDKKLSLLRRNSLKNEVDGIWDEFEAVEDGEPLPGKNVVTHGECINLRRVLPENAQDKLPKMCRTPDSHVGTALPVSSTQLLPRSLSGGFPGAFNSMSSQTLGGEVNEEECETLQTFLSGIAGGTFLVPSACGPLLKAKEDQMRKTFEGENAEVYKRLKRRMTYVAQKDWPPTAA
eukprot:253890_1